MSIYVVEEPKEPKEPSQHSDCFRIAQTHLPLQQFMASPDIIKNKPNIVLWYSTGFTNSKRDDYTRICRYLDAQQQQNRLYNGYDSALVKCSLQNIEKYLDVYFGHGSIAKLVKQKNVFIYVLELEQGKYYVGKTNDPQFRIQTHFNNNTGGSVWTKRFKPVRVLELIPDCDDYDEDKYTKKYMDTYGIDNVRGGSFVSVELDSFTKEQLVKMSNGTNNRCFKCGEDTHFVKDCRT
jgi:hypothetical protein